ncbi:MAG: ribosomal protein methyltransferase [Devosia sp.]|nr:ribosomal protein methyltransferase [Devosia sp.]
MPLSQLSAPLSKDQAYALVDAVMDDGELAVTASAHEDLETGEWVFEATCNEAPDVEAFSELARLTLGGAVEFAIEPIDPEINWVAKSLEGLQPVIAGGFYVYGSHETGPIPAGMSSIRIDAAQAFGTGHHETTTGCLEAIDRVLKHSRPRNLLDVGTGTGILAIALAMRTRLPVIATDIDPIAVKTTAENARDNGVAGLIHPLVAAGLDHPAIARAAPYNLIVANILAKPLIDIAASMSRASTRGGTAILSGLLDRQASSVTAAYVQCGYRLTRKIIRGEWATLILQKR